MTSRHIWTSLMILGLAGSAAAQETARFENRTPNTLAGSAEVPSPRATLQDMGWFAGNWTGDGLGGVSEESWSAPAGGAMMGMFRNLKDGKVVFYEFLTLVEHEGSLLLKLKHFNPDLTGWEEKNDNIKFRLLKIGRDEIAFDGLTFRRDGDDAMKIFLALRSKADGTVREAEFTMKRIK